tara:strand:+ start:2864 stop:3346 length:483 start_codon:yes stop_codon:yes gene_type:complete
MIKKIENVLKKEEYEKILYIVTEDPDFSLYYRKGVADPKDNDFFFFHVLYIGNKINSHFFEPLMFPLMGVLNFSKIVRAKVNCYTNQGRQVENKFHTDNNDPHMVAIYNINDNNGYTEFETGERIVSKANELIMFDGSIKHRSVTQTDANLRLNININYV